ncbi:diguanylate cyclase [Deinococcus frigens]|uniref:diguanylate cyclase n=1 Tax=Deinococcus frigens TaxID=249403 RepID=UPI00138E0815|nr:diguanylate cyclase [Deinococcus frigens]
MRLARVVLEQPLEDAELARATLCLGCGWLHQGEFGAAESELRRALHLYGELADQEGQRISLRMLGIAQHEQGRPVEALKTFVQVRQLSVTLGHVQGEIDALNGMGAAYSTMGNHSDALEYHLRVLRLGRHHGLPRMERIALNNLSADYLEMQRYDDALEAAMACLNVQMDEEIPLLDASAHGNAGQAYSGLQQFSRARDMFEQVIVLMERSGYQAGIARCTLDLGRVAQQQGALDEAQRLFERSLEIQRETGEGHGQAESLRCLGELLGESGQVEDALSALHSARTLAEEGRLRNELCKVDLALSQLYRQAGRFPEALTHLEWHLQLKGELFSADSDRRLQSLKVQSDLDQAERERQAAQRLNAELSELNARLEETNRDLRAAQAQTAELMARLEQHANEDALTGLPNRRAFDAALTGVSPSQQVSVVLCDIDHFKMVNDRFSHLIGDEALRHVAALLRGRLRRGDLLARYGGEEFVLLLTGASESATRDVCEDLRRAIENHDWPSVRPGLSLTVSLGAAVARLSPTLSVQDVIQAADDALYAAKHAGRNRVDVRLAAPSAV